MISRFLKNSWLGSLVLAGIFLLADASVVVQNLERWAYDWGVRAASQPADSRVVLVVIDDRTLANMDGWPWQRKEDVQLILNITRGSPSLIVETRSFTRQTPNLTYLNQALEWVNGSSLGRLSKQPSPTLSEENTKIQADLQKLVGILTDAVRAFDTDRDFATSWQHAGNIILQLEVGSANGQDTTKPPLPDYVLRHALPKPNKPLGIHYQPRRGQTVVSPMSQLVQHTVGTGFFPITPDPDGTVRGIDLIIEYFDTYLPSLPLLTAITSLNYKSSDIHLTAKNHLSFGPSDIVAGEQFRLYNFFYRKKGWGSPFTTYSFFDVWKGSVSPENFRNKIVIIGPSASALVPHFQTPVHQMMAPMELLAHSLTSLLNQDYVVRPTWAPWLKQGLYLLVLIILVYMLPRFSRILIITSSFVLVTLFLGTHAILMTVYRIWVPLIGPVSLLILGTVWILAKQQRKTMPGYLSAGPSAANANRMLGLALQGQGRLDAALEKFRLCPMDKLTLELLYDLALAYEHNRQFQKAIYTLNVIKEHNKNFRDINRRLTDVHTLLTDPIDNDPIHSAEIPTTVLPLHERFRLENKLADGTLGTVFRARNTQDNRVLAVKVIIFKERFHEDFWVRIKAIIVEEMAKTAKINHPNIVKVIDTEITQSQAFVVMEFFSGQTLQQFMHPDRLLPVPLVIQIIGKVAMALNYTHRLGIIHGGLRPTNILFDPATREVRITGFGLSGLLDEIKVEQHRQTFWQNARLHLAPEQRLGDRPDQTSDIFALGILFYQLITGYQPFSTTESGRVSGETSSPRPLKTLRPDLPECLRAMIEKTLSKRPSDRYQTCIQLAKHLVECVKSQV